MTVEIREVKTAADRKAFVNLPFEVYKNNPFWVPPLKADEIKSIDPGKNPAFGYVNARFWIALKNGKCVGRIGAIIHAEYNVKSGEELGRFTRLEFFDDAEVVDALVATAENWIREQGMKGVHGPLGFSNLDTQGVQVEGFDYLPSIASVYHQPYYHTHLERLGYAKEIDWIEFRLKVEETIPEKAVKLNELVKQRYNLKVLSFNSTAELMPYAPKVFEVLNQAFAELPYVTPFSEKLIAYYSDRYFKLLNPKFVKVIQDAEGKLVGFIVGLPSLSRAMQKANGSLLPFGWWHIMQALKHPTEVDLLLTGVLPEAQGQGVPAVLIMELQQVLISHGVKHVETTGMFETNQKAIQHWKNYDHIQHKRKRVYRKMF